MTTSTVTRTTNATTPTTMPTIAPVDSPDCSPTSESVSLDMVVTVSASVVLKSPESVRLSSSPIVVVSGVDSYIQIEKKIIVASNNSLGFNKHSDFDLYLWLRLRIQTSTDNYNNIICHKNLYNAYTAHTHTHTHTHTCMPECQSIYYLPGAVLVTIVLVDSIIGVDICAEQKLSYIHDTDILVAVWTI